LAAIGASSARTMRAISAVSSELMLTVLTVLACAEKERFVRAMRPRGSTSDANKELSSSASLISRLVF